MAITTANDEEERDPVNLLLEGSTDGSSFTQVGPIIQIDCVDDRFYTRFFDIPNTNVYQYYRFSFYDLCNPAGNSANSMQLAEIQLYGE